MPDTIYTAPNVAYISTEALDRGTLDFLKAIDIWKGRCFASERENQRLRAALESLTSDPPSTLDEPDEDWQVIVKMRAVAHAALAHTNGTREGEA